VVDWRCAGSEDVHEFANMSLAGLFLETHRSSGVGSTAKLEFLVQEDRSGPTPLCGVSSQAGIGTEVHGSE